MLPEAFYFTRENTNHSEISAVDVTPPKKISRDYQQKGFALHLVDSFFSLYHFVNLWEYRKTMS